MKRIRFDEKMAITLSEEVLINHRIVENCGIVGLVLFDWPDDVFQMIEWVAGSTPLPVSFRRIG